MANEFLPFALDQRANLVHTDNWVDDKERLRGFSTGPSRSAKANRVWRQSSFVAAAIAQYIADSIGEDVLDNGDQAAFIDQFRRAIGARHEILVADLDLYVSITGNDNNTGTPDRPFRTLQAATDYVLYRVDPGSFTVNINVGPGTYEDGVSIEGPITANPWQLNFIGNELNPSTTVIAKTSGSGPCFEAGNGACYTIAGFELHNATSPQYLGGSAIGTWEYASIFAYNVNLGNCTNPQLMAWNAGMGVYQNINIVGNAPRTILMSAMSNFEIAPGKIMVVGNPIIPVFAEVNRLSNAALQLQSVGGSTLTDTRQCIVSGNSILSTTLALPGNAIPITSSGGLYVGPGGISVLSEEGVPLPEPMEIGGIGNWRQRR